MVNTSLKLKPRVDSLADRREFLRKLSRSAIYRDYKKAFTTATGLPLALNITGSLDLEWVGEGNKSPFCALLANSNQGCAECLKMQDKLEREAQIKPRTLKCFAGLCDSAVPIRVGENVVAFLKTGQVLLHQPNDEHFTKLTRKILSLGTRINLKRLEEAYFQSRVLSPDQYRAFVQLLSTFASHLASISNAIMVEEKNSEPEMVAKARRFILENYDSPLTLNKAARAVNTSSHYFCKMFKKTTGMTFTEYLTRIRIEKAKNLLYNPNKRVSEVAFDIGFESLSQFNRSFKRITGATPTGFRKNLENWQPKLRVI